VRHSAHTHHYSIWIFRGALEPRKLRVPRPAGFIMALAVGLIVITFPVLTYQYVSKAMRCSTLEKRLSREAAQVASLSDNMKIFRAQIHRLRDFDTRLRIIANLGSEEASGPLLGVGGVNTSLGGIRSDADQLADEMDRLREEARFRERSFRELYSFLEGKRQQLACTPSVRPVRGWLTSEFGYRRDPFTGLRQFHEGIDIANRIGTNVVATADGVVSGIREEFGLGLTVMLNHGYGFVTRYGHLSKVHVKVGERVKRGQVIAQLGNSGRSTGPHVHYEVRLNGLPANPLHYILN